ncbi:MAG: hypothetical protein KKF67_01905 [Nanoarchaeota archaeon]|nr:hypothetical protein [Nanoarchaeota archaeon]
MCNLCNTKPVYEFTNKRKLCKTCYIRWFEKKLLYTIRKYNMIKKNDVVRYIKEDDFRSIVLEESLKILADKGRVKLTKGIKYNKFAVPATIDLTANKIFRDTIKKPVELSNTKPVHKKIIKPLYLFLDREILLYAKLKKLKFKVSKEKKNKIEKFLDELEEKHPEVKRAIVNSYLSIN